MEDFDECLSNNGGCSHFCHNEVGSYKCSCPPNMTLSHRGDYCIGELGRNLLGLENFL